MIFYEIRMFSSELSAFVLDSQKEAIKVANSRGIDYACRSSDYSVFVDRSGDYTSTEITYIMLAAGAIVFVALAIGESLIQQGSISQLAALPFRDAGFLSAVLYQVLSNIAIAKIGVNRTASFIGVSTVVSVVAGVVLLHESFTAFQIVGAAIIIIGVYTANSRKSLE